MSETYVYKIRKGEQTAWKSWNEANRLVEKEGWEFVMEDGNYVFQCASAK